MIKKIFKKLPLIRWFLDVRKELSLIRHQTNIQTRIQQNILKEILSNKHHTDNKSFPSEFEHQTFSQNGEDGILIEILNRIGSANNRFLELGSGDGTENNTKILLELGWKGLWVDGEKENCTRAKYGNERHVKSGSLEVKHSLVTIENINQILEEFENDIDVLSIDLDLNTYHLWEAINSSLCARVVIIEYNGFFPSDSDWVAEYRSDERWEGGIEMGASLSSISKLSKEKGYRLIGCEVTGTNAFFIREELAEVHFPESKNTGKFFKPARPYLTNNPEHRIDIDPRN
jgi:hypothetical protein